MNKLEKPKYIEDLKDFDEKQTSIWLSSKAKNIERLNDLKIENLWLNGANEKELEKILKITNPKNLNLYYLLAKELKVLESLENTEIITLEWNTKAENLWDISKNSSLKNLEIKDFAKLNKIDEISFAKQISKLSIGGGISKPLKIKSLKPLEDLSNLTFLNLMNLKVEDDSLKPIEKLKNLKLLEISNQFETSEYAYLSAKMKNTECNMFNATNKCIITDANNNLVWDTMITGRGKSFLLSSKDQSKIEKHILNFEKLKNNIC